MNISDGEVLLRLAVATVLCGVIGLERESRDQVAGLRTHILVGVGATLFTLVSAYGFESFFKLGAAGTGPRIDPTRIAAQIVSGIGFLGAGAIIRQGFNVRGLTTAATLWVVAAIGMAAGAGYYFGAVITTALVLPALIVFRRLRPALMSRIRADYVVLDLEIGDTARLGEAFGLLAQRGVEVLGMNSELESVRLQMRVPPGVAVERLVADLAALPGISEVTASDVGFRRRSVRGED